LGSGATGVSIGLCLEAITSGCIFSSRFNKTIDIRLLFRLKTFPQMTAQ
jgi:hypothetical protein